MPVAVIRTFSGFMFRWNRPDAICWKINPPAKARPRFEIELLPCMQKQSAPWMFEERSHRMQWCWDEGVRSSVTIRYSTTHLQFVSPEFIPPTFAYLVHALDCHHSFPRSGEFAWSLRVLQAVLVLLTQPDNICWSAMQFERSVSSIASWLENVNWTH